MIKTILTKQLIKYPNERIKSLGVGIAPSNIALIKYWGKRSEELNLPSSSSLSISLGYRGTVTIARLALKEQYSLNGIIIPTESDFARRMRAFLDLFRPLDCFFTIEIRTNLPIASGFASSASGFAALVLALNDLFDWHLPVSSLSILARLGSGSACRSIEHGFISWFRGQRTDGLDSYGVKLEEVWPDLRLGLLKIDISQKKISSREAMKSVNKSIHYLDWCRYTELAWKEANQAILCKDFESLGALSERHSDTMHALISETGIEYSCSDTFKQIMRVRELRKKGTLVFYTQDAGANLVLLTSSKDLPVVQKAFPIEVVNPNVDNLNSLVLDLNHRQVGKLQAHALGIPHLAFSVLVYRRQGNQLEFLLQQRSSSKYHSANLWSNTCCGHPGGEILLAAERRLSEEMGFTLPLRAWGKINYQIVLGNLQENEEDYLFWGDGSFLENIYINEVEVQAYRWINSYALSFEMKNHPENFTPWFRYIFDWLFSHWAVWKQQVLTSN